MGELLAFRGSSMLQLPQTPLCTSRGGHLPVGWRQASLAVTSPMCFSSTRLMTFPTFFAERKQCSWRTRASNVSDAEVPTTFTVDSEAMLLEHLSMSQKLTLGYAALVGVGGVMGYLKGGSRKSLIAGGLSASLLYYVYTLLPSDPVLASSLGLVLSVSLMGVMGSRIKKSGKIFPAGIVAFASLVMTGGYLHGILRSLD
ncbi:protein FATTY ACID EXPORT 2, chloroplastic [Sesamum alatum]|uniref:Protein FATTY ACID EXPORT 2, chloroplastic n=1 Tax=Sesamum alatum TaxID=300844 RepID=A0AAE2C8Z8_9LAMI|nr:protein FATTY ACID EXPORT 2, chloroplastic [Sesamum alatum]